MIEAVGHCIDYEIRRLYILQAATYLLMASVWMIPWVIWWLS